MATTTDSVLRGGIAAHGDELRLTLDPRFQGLPDTAHGGSVLAAFQVVAGLAGRQEVRGVYRKRVPVGTPLRLTVAHRNGGMACRLFDDTNAVLVEGGVHPVAEAAESAASFVTGAARPASAEGGVLQGGRGSVGDVGDPLPVSSTCFACGLDNELGLRAQFLFDDTRVWARWAPRETTAAADGSLAPIALTALLDEAAFWLGALASGESGMTIELAVTLHRSIAHGAPILVAGARSRTRARGDDRRYWETEVAAVDASGRVVASGRITFVALRGAARRLVTGLLALNSPDILRRVFPAYTR